VAVTLVACARVTTQGPVPLHAVPLQPVKVLFPVASAVSVSVVFSGMYTTVL
jgi:hypothetical protein